MVKLINDNYIEGLCIELSDMGWSINSNNLFSCEDIRIKNSTKLYDVLKSYCSFYPKSETVSIKYYNSLKISKLDSTSLSISDFNILNSELASILHRLSKRTTDIKIIPLNQSYEIISYMDDFIIDNPCKIVSFCKTTNNHFSNIGLIVYPEYDTINKISLYAREYKNCTRFSILENILENEFIDSSEEIKIINGISVKFITSNRKFKYNLLDYITVIDRFKSIEESQKDNPYLKYQNIDDIICKLELK